MELVRGTAGRGYRGTGGFEIQTSQQRVSHKCQTSVTLVIIMDPPQHVVEAQGVTEKDRMIQYGPPLDNQQRVIRLPAFRFLCAINNDDAPSLRLHIRWWNNFTAESTLVFDPKDYQWRPSTPILLPSFATNDLKRVPPKDKVATCTFVLRNSLLDELVLAVCSEDYQPGQAQKRKQRRAKKAQQVQTAAAAPPEVSLPGGEADDVDLDALLTDLSPIITDLEADGTKVRAVTNSFELDALSEQVKSLQIDMATKKIGLQQAKQERSELEAWRQYLSMLTALKNWMVTKLLNLYAGNIANNRYIYGVLHSDGMTPIGHLPQHYELKSWRHTVLKDGWREILSKIINVEAEALCKLLETEHKLLLTAESIVKEKEDLNATQLTEPPYLHGALERIVRHK